MHHYISHAPFHKIVRKGLARIALADWARAERAAGTTTAATAAAAEGVGGVGGTRTEAQEELLGRIGEAVGAPEPELGAEKGGEAHQQQHGEEGEAAGDAALCGCPPLSSAATWRLGDRGLEGRLLGATGELFTEVGEDAAWLQRKVSSGGAFSGWLVSGTSVQGAGYGTEVPLWWC